MKIKALLIVTILVFAVAACALTPKAAPKTGKPTQKAAAKQANKQNHQGMKEGNFGGHGPFLMLNLTDAQKTKMKSIRESSRKKEMAVMSNSKLSEDAKQKKMMAIRKKSREQMSAILTPEQRKKFDEMRKQHPKFGQGPGRPDKNTRKYNFK